MGALRFNHMELTLPPGALDEGGIREEIRGFYTEVFGFDVKDIDIVKQNALMLRTDRDLNQFILLTQMEQHMQSPGYDHLGFAYETRAEVEEVLEKCRKYQERDDRVQLKLYEDIDTGRAVIKAFYVKYLLPIWFDVQSWEFKSAELAPAKRWTYA